MKATINTQTATNKQDATRAEQLTIKAEKQKALNNALMSCFNAENEALGKRAALEVAILDSLGKAPKWKVYAEARTTALDAVSPTPKNGGDKTKRDTATTLWNRAVHSLKKAGKFTIPLSDDPEAENARTDRKKAADEKAAQEADEKAKGIELEAKIAAFASDPKLAELLEDRVKFRAGVEARNAKAAAYDDVVNLIDINDEINLLMAAIRHKTALFMAWMNTAEAVALSRFIDAARDADKQHQEPKDVTPEVELLPAPTKAKRAKKAA